MLFLASCENTSNDVEPNDENTEFKHIRLLVSDENSSELSLVNPYTNEVQSFDAQYAKSRLYTTESGRYAAIIHREDNLLQTFDIGLEFHGDHVDVRGTPKFGALVGESALPTHFKSKKGQLLTFNDGDGTLSVANESDIHTQGMKMKTINAGLEVHHGAMAHFNNGNYAVTEKVNVIPGVLPERVKVIDADENTVHESSIETAGIHGNATDGTVAVFGSASGILVVNSSGEQKLIPHPEDFDTAWFGAILETSKEGYFLGYTGSKGVYLINTTSGEITAIHASSDIMSAKPSMDQSKIAILSHSGDLVYKDLFTGEVINSLPGLLAATATDETQKPQMAVSGKYAYITQPKTGELLMVNLSEGQIQERIKVSSTPYQLTILGYENSESH
ncbi:hypothetical protein [Jiulongibacter sp. NS-SX5]|uniref:hypothetical protein n=1 Tax=Jiulongibacter sp. NS-SX5 TaxID=3463854 RepID=UPI0040581FDE